MYKVIIILLAVITITACGQSSTKEKSSEPSSDTTMYYFVRHAEKDLSDPSNRNPKLTEEGEKRAQDWKDYFKDKNIQAVYSTNYERTMNTALPTANAAGLLISNYSPSDLYSQDFKKATKGLNTVVVGHSNTTPTFVNKVIGKETYTDIDESEYGHIYIVTVTDGVATVQHKEFD